MGKCDIFRCRYGCCSVRIRLVVASILFLAMLVCFGHRSVFSVAIAEMAIPNNKTTHRACPQNAKSSTMKKVDSGKRKWNQNVQVWLLALFFPGYVLSQVPGGFICDRWGARWVLLIGITISGLVTFLTPHLVLNMDWKVVAGMRFIAGLGQGILYPAATSCIQRWIPHYERATVGGIVYGASYCGTVIANTLTGPITKYFKSWKAVFSFWGTLTVIWVSFAFLYLFSFPESHPFISPLEERFLQDEIGKRRKRPLPFCKVLTSAPVWALAAAQFSQGIVMFTMISNFPKYMKNVLNFNIKENGYISSIPFAMLWVSAVLFGLVSDFLVLKMNMNVTLVRKSYALFSSIFPAVFIMAATYSNCNRMLAVIFFSLAMFSKGPAYSSFKVNCMDLTIAYGGLVMGFTNALGSFAGFLSAKIIGWVAKENTLEQWHNLLWGFMAVQIFFMTLYCIFGSCERAAWDYLPKERKAPTRKSTTKWYLQLPPEDFEEMEMMQMAAAARRNAAL